MREFPLIADSDGGAVHFNDKCVAGGTPLCSLFEAQLVTMLVVTSRDCCPSKTYQTGDRSRSLPMRSLLSLSVDLAILSAQA